MARSYSSAEASWRRRGYGEGRGRDYRPWGTVRSPSWARGGMVHRIRGVKTRRVHHLRGGVQLGCFFLLDWREEVTDIREHFPLHPLAETQEIANELGYRHPRRSWKCKGRRFSEERTLTTDFLVDFDCSPPKVAIATEYAARLRRARTLRSLEIERRYWRRRGVPWRLVTEKDLPEVAVRNASLLLHYWNLEGHGLPPDPSETLALLPALYERLTARPDQPMGRTCEAFDAAHDLPRGASTVLAWHALARRMWRTDAAREALSPGRPLPGLCAGEMWSACDASPGGTFPCVAP